MYADIVITATLKCPTILNIHFYVSQPLLKHFNIIINDIRLYEIVLFFKVLRIVVNYSYLHKNNVILCSQLILVNTLTIQCHIIYYEEP